MAKLYITQYEVVGNGQFPTDMLRYDGSYPARTEDAIAMTTGFNTWGADRPKGPTRVRLTHRDTYAGWEPTHDRWTSFGWAVDRSTERKWTA